MNIHSPRGVSKEGANRARSLSVVGLKTHMKFSRFRMTVGSLQFIKRPIGHQLILESRFSSVSTGGLIWLLCVPQTLKSPLYSPSMPVYAHSFRRVACVPTMDVICYSLCSYSCKFECFLRHFIIRSAFDSQSDLSFKYRGKRFDSYYKLSQKIFCRLRT